MTPTAQDRLYRDLLELLLHHPFDEPWRDGEPRVVHQVDGKWGIALLLDRDYPTEAAAAHVEADWQRIFNNVRHALHALHAIRSGEREEPSTNGFPPVTSEQRRAITAMAVTAGAFPPYTEVQSGAASYTPHRGFHESGEQAVGWDAALGHGCQYCGAPPDHWCVTSTRNIAAQPHAQRLGAAAAAHRQAEP